MGRTKFIAPVLMCLVFSTHGVIDPVVNTSVGIIRGHKASDGDYDMFLGIPYATVNPADPFGPSTPQAPFEETFPAVDDSIMCPQIDEFRREEDGSLDCLRLNVYVPIKASPDEPLPVLVWIHGGGFNYGHGGRFTHGPKYLVRHDIVVVTFNYRLGAFGFLCLDTPEYPGNQGLKDQLLALRWVKQNIRQFGGDADKITIAGQSAGGISTDIHLIYNQENLFNKVIIQSGVSLSPSSFVEANPHAPVLIAEALGSSISDPNEALEFLKTVEPRRIANATARIRWPAGPCIEKEFENVERLITGDPTEVDRPNVKNVPILIGFTNMENNFGLMPIDMIVDPFNLLTNFFEYEGELLADVVSNMRRFYIGDAEVSAAVSDDIGKFRSDIAFLHPTYRSIEKYFENEATSIHHYMFSYKGERNFLQTSMNVNVNGALHADELGYLFDIGIFEDPPTPADQLIIDRITTLWTNFVKYSDPTPSVTSILPVQVPAINVTMNCLNIDSEMTLLRRPFNNRMAFWDMFYKMDKLYSMERPTNTNTTDTNGAGKLHGLTFSSFLLLPTVYLGNRLN